MTMSSLLTVRSANDALAKRYDRVTGIFTGATNGIGLATLHAFVKHIPRPRAIVAGRSRRNFQDEVEILKQLNPDTEIIFIESDLSLIHNGDAASKDMASHISRHNVDFVCMSQGYAPIEGRKFTSEGLDQGMSLFYYGRVRLVQKLISSGILKHDAKILSIVSLAKHNTPMAISDKDVSGLPACWRQGGTDPGTRPCSGHSLQHRDNACCGRHLHDPHLRRAREAESKHEFSPVISWHS